MMFMIGYNFQPKNVTGHTAPLYPRAEDAGEKGELNLNSSLTYLQSQGFAMKSLILGMFLGGKSYNLKSVSNNGLGAPAKQGFAGLYLQSEGTVGYNELCEKLILEQSSWTFEWDDEQRIPYVVAGDAWVSYENERSIAEKMAMASKFGLGGAMVWAVDTDDFRGRCGNGTYPLLMAVNKGLGKNVTRTPPEAQKPVIPSCTIATKPGVAVDVYACGANLTIVECKQGGRVPYGSQVVANCWESNTIFMNCDPDGFWRTLEDTYADGWRMKELCQPDFVNSPICGRRPALEKTEVGFHPRLSGGGAEESHPWVAGLLRNNEAACTATVITASKLLTAAHCVTRTQEGGSTALDVRNLKVVFGSSFQEWVVSIEIHPDYHHLGSRTPVNDIAILTLEKPVRFNSRIFPACLNLESHLVSDRSATTFDLNPGPNLHYEPIEQKFDPNCHTPFNPCFNTLGNASTQFCGLPEVPDQNLRTGSSGGPFLQNLGTDADEKWTVSGVVSQTVIIASCDHQRTVMTSVFPYKDWIVDLVNEKLLETPE